MNILIIEDEDGISQFLKQQLEDEGFAVTVAIDGIEGLRLALNGGYQLILLDWMLPKMNGLEVCIRLREKDSATPILFLTAKDTIQETVAGLKSGANDYIKKPFSFEELLERIKVQLRGSVAQVSELMLGSILIKKDTRQVYNNGEEAVLTQKEFALLEYLVENKGKVCTRSSILEKVWNIRFDYDTGVIDVFINSLRKKLGLSREDNYIRTVRGIGYIANDTEDKSETQ